MTLVALTDKDRQLGDALLWPVCSADGTVLIKSGYVIGASEEIDTLLQGEVFFDKTPLKRPPPKYAQEKVPPILLFPELVLRVSRLLQRVQLDKIEGGFEEEVRTLAHSLLGARPADQDEWLGALHLHFNGEYTHYHPVQTAVLCLFLGRTLGVDTATLETILCAALTMNIGMLKLQKTLYHQKNPLTAEQQAEIRAHPARSVEMLQGFGVADGAWLEMIKHHHEKIDGSGYPGNLRQDEISLGGKMIMMCEAYCATISPRAYRPGLRADQTILILQKAKGSSVDERMTDVLAQMLGKYPPGSVVQLTNGEIGIISRRNPDALPNVSAVIGANGFALMTPVSRNPNNQSAHQIKEMLPFQKLGNVTNFTKVWG